MIQRKTWRDFKDAKLLWFVNRILHVFGWSIILVTEEDGDISEAYPARVKFRGFDEKSESEGFVGITNHLAETIDELRKEAAE